MSVFGTYAQYYDLLYAGKDYGREVEYIRGFIQEYSPDARNILELGSGTGIHASLLARDGYSVTGLDLSADMLARARERHAAAIASGALDFQQADIRDFDLARQFDVVVALFHVISYLPSDHDLDRTFSNIAAHLKPGGLLLFDHWHGPGVLADPPTHRTRQLENDMIEVTRIATPAHDRDAHLVDVRYDLTIIDKASRRADSFTETHRMRYLFPAEIESVLSRHGLRLVGLREWLADRAPDEKSWNGFAIAAKRP